MVQHLYNHFVENSANIHKPFCREESSIYVRKEFCREESSTYANHFVENSSAYMKRYANQFVENSPAYMQRYANHFVEKMCKNLHWTHSPHNCLQNHTLQIHAKTCTGHIPPTTVYRITLFRFMQKLELDTFPPQLSTESHS